MKHLNVRHIDIGTANPGVNGYTEPGWYFSDEVESLHGPFDNEAIARTTLIRYVEDEL